MAQLVEDDEAKLLVNLVNQSNRLPRNLTGGSANLIWSIDAGAATTSGMTLEDAANGKVSYRFTTGQLTPGVLRGDVQSTDSAGVTVIARDVVRLQIRRKIT